MDNYFSAKNLQKFAPFILLAGVVLIGGYLLVRKGIISLPAGSQNGSSVDIGKTSVVELLFTGKEYKLSYAAMNPSALVDIARYDKTEQWQGTGSIEDDVTFGGKVLSMSDRDRQMSSSVLLKNLNLANVDNIKFVVNYKSDKDNVESLNLLLGNKDGTSNFRFPISNLVSGMNYFSIPKYRFFLVGPNGSETPKTSTGAVTASPALSWDKIERVELQLLSRPDSKIMADIGWIRGEKEGVFNADWNWDGNEHFLSLDHTAEGKLVLRIKQVGRSIATLRKVGSVADFTYSAKITSVKEGFVGLLFRGDYKTGLGYYLSVGGLGTGDWSLSKIYMDAGQAKSLPLLRGQLANFEFSKDQPFWLKVSTKGDSITAYFSLDGTKYTKLGEVSDDSIGSGGIGVTSSSGAALFDDFQLTVK